MTVNSKCWLDCIALSENQEDHDCKLRAVRGIAGISELNSDLAGITTIYRLVAYFSKSKLCLNFRSSFC